MIKPKPMQSYDRIEVSNEGIFVNDKAASNELRDVGVYTALRDFVAIAPGCPFCKSRLVTTGGVFNAYNHDADELEDEDIGPHIHHYLWYCRHCRFWQWYYLSDNDPVREREHQYSEGCPPGPEQFAYISKLREFDAELPSVCSSELAQYLRRQPHAWHRYEPRRFEKLVADIIRANHTGAEVVHIGQPDDGGVDILFIDTNKEQWLVQVKRRENEHSAAGVSTIRNLIGTMVLENALRGIVVSTADHFTLRARQAASKVKSHGLCIELIDKGVLNRMLEPVLPDRPWLPVVKAHSINLAEMLSAIVESDYQYSLFDYQSQ